MIVEVLVSPVEILEPNAVLPTNGLPENVPEGPQSSADRTLAPDELRQQIDESRHALAEKLHLLEAKVTESVQVATETVTEATAAVVDTVATAKATVAETVNSVQTVFDQTVNSVKNTVAESVNTVTEQFQISRQVQKHPWWSLAASVAAGYCAGQILTRASSPPPQRLQRQFTGQQSPWGTPVAPDVVPLTAHSPIQSETQAAPHPQGKTNSPANNIADHFQNEIAQLQQLAIGVTAGIIRDAVVNAVPPSLKPTVHSLADDMTTRLGGKIFAEPILSTPMNSSSPSP